MWINYYATKQHKVNKFFTFHPLRKFITFFDGKRHRDEGWKDKSFSKKGGWEYILLTFSENTPAKKSSSHFLLPFNVWVETLNRWRNKNQHEKLNEFNRKLYLIFYFLLFLLFLFFRLLNCNENEEKTEVEWGERNFWSYK